MEIRDLSMDNFQYNNEECKKAHNTVYEIIAPIRALLFIYETVVRKPIYFYSFETYSDTSLVKINLKLANV